MQVTGYRAQVTENLPKMLDTPLSFSLDMFFIICFIPGYATNRHMFAIDHALSFCN